MQSVLALTPQSAVPLFKRSALTTTNNQSKAAQSALNPVFLMVCTTLQCSITRTLQCNQIEIIRHLLWTIEALLTQASQAVEVEQTTSFNKFPAQALSSTQLTMSIIARLLCIINKSLPTRMLIELLMRTSRCQWGKWAVIWEAWAHTLCKQIHLSFLRNRNSQSYLMIISIKKARTNNKSTQAISRIALKSIR